MTVETIYPTLLRVPDLRGAVRLREIPLKGMPIDYLVQQHHGWWMVTSLTDGETVYAGPGPVEVELWRDLPIRRERRCNGK